MSNNQNVDQFDWVKEGGRAYVRQFSGFGADSLTPVTIEKVSKTRVTARPESGNLKWVFFVPKYGTAVLTEMGGASSYRYSSELIGPQDKAVARIKARNRVRNLETTALAAVSDFRIGRSIEQARTAIGALQDFIDAKEAE